MDVTDASDRDLAESIGAFKAALSAQPSTLLEPSVGRILWALDGSNQDETAAELAMTMARRFEASLTMLHAGSDAAVDQHVDRLAGPLRDVGVDVDVASPEDADAQPPAFELILAHQRRLECDLVIVNAPHGEDFATLGDASVGTNLDMLMSRCPVALLVVREPRAEVIESLGHALVPLTVHEPTVLAAASWAVRILSGDGDLRLLAVVDREHAEASVESLETDTDVAELGEEVLAGLRRPRMAGLIAAVQRRCSELGLGCRVSVRVGEPAAIAAQIGNERSSIIVTGCPRRPLDVGYQRVQALTRASRNPLLIV